MQPRPDWWSWSSTRRAGPCRRRRSIVTMCGIVGVVRRRAQRASPELSSLRDLLDTALQRLDSDDPLVDRLAALTREVTDVDALLRGAPGVRALLSDPDGATAIGNLVDAVTTRLGGFAAELDAVHAAGDPASQEAVNAALVTARDAAWAVGHDRLLAARGVLDLAGDAWQHDGGLDAYLSAYVALAALDRLEVRGRDSAGL